jgi:hypothetical protein
VSELLVPICFLLGLGVVVTYCVWVVRQMLKRFR